MHTHTHTQMLEECNNDLTSHSVRAHTHTHKRIKNSLNVQVTCNNCSLFRLREERLQRIARYKTRLALLLPPIVEQQLRNDTATGN